MLRFLAEWTSNRRIVFPCFRRSECVKPHHFHTEWLIIKSSSNGLKQRCEARSGCKWRCLMSAPSQANIAPFLKPRNNPLPPHSAIVSAISWGPHNSPTAAGRGAGSTVQIRNRQARDTRRVPTVPCWTKPLSPVNGTGGLFVNRFGEWHLESLGTPSLGHHSRRQKKTESNSSFVHRHFQNSATPPVSFCECNTPLGSTQRARMTNQWWVIWPRGLGTMRHPSSTGVRRTHALCPALAPHRGSANGFCALQPLVKCFHQPGAPPSPSEREAEPRFLLSSQEIASLCLERALFHVFLWRVCCVLSALLLWWFTFRRSLNKDPGDPSPRLPVSEFSSKTLTKERSETKKGRGWVDPEASQN